jgi:hypothetical protein
VLEEVSVDYQACMEPVLAFIDQMYQIGYYISRVSMTVDNTTALMTL